MKATFKTFSSMRCRRLRVLATVMAVFAGSSMLPAGAQRHVTVGTVDELFKAVSDVRSLPGNDTVYVHIKPGHYYLYTPLQLTGADRHPMVFEGDAADKPVISGAIRLSQWRKTPQGWWVCNVPEVQRYGRKFEQLYVNGVRATRARTPDKGWFKLTGSKETAVVRGTGRAAAFAGLLLNTAADNLNTLKGLSERELNDIVSVFYHKWSVSRKPLDYAVPDSGMMAFAGHGDAPWNPLRKGTRFYLENYKAALTAPGEWFLDDGGTLYYIPHDGEDIETTVAHAPVLESWINIDGSPDARVNGKTFRNIIFSHTASYMPRMGTSGAQAAANVSAAFNINHADNINITDCEFSHTGGYALAYGNDCHGGLVTRCLITDLGAGGIEIGSSKLPETDGMTTEKIVVDNNIISETGMIHASAVGVIIFNGARCKVVHNDIYDLRYTGISVGWQWGYGPSMAVGNEIGYNHVHHVGWGKLSDMAAIYTLGISNGTRVHHNVVHDVFSYDYGGWGLYNDEGSSGIVMDCNLVYNTKSGSYHLHYGRDNIIRNNIFGQSLLRQIHHTKPEDHRSLTFTNNIVVIDRGVMLYGPLEQFDMVYDHNCYYDYSNKSPLFGKVSFAEWQKKHDKHSLLADPLFVDAKNNDYRLRSKKIAKRIGFKPFDYTKAGVYGSAEWKAKAVMNPEKVKEFGRFFK